MSYNAVGNSHSGRSNYEAARRRQRERARSQREARKAAADAALRRRVARIHIPGADTSDIDRELAMASARQHVLQRDVRRESSRLHEMSRFQGELRGRAQAAWREQVAVEKAAWVQLETQFDEACAKVQELHAQRVQGMREVRDSLRCEAHVDAETAVAGRARQQQMLAEAEGLLRGVDAETATAMGLDTRTVARRIRTARQRSEGAGLVAANLALAETHGLADELSWRCMRLEALKGEYLERISELRAQLQFTDEARAYVVGRGDLALDRPLRRRLEQLSASVEGISRHESHEVRFVVLAEDLDDLADRVSDLAGQVAEFDSLDRERARIVGQELPDLLEEVLGEPTTLCDVREPELGLQPVQARLRTARGEQVDCAVQLDGTLRVHHHGHADVRTCNDAAQRWARAMSERVAISEPPVLDIAAERGEG